MLNNTRTQEILLPGAILKATDYLKMSFRLATEDEENQGKRTRGEHSQYLSVELQLKQMGVSGEQNRV